MTSQKLLILSTCHLHPLEASKVNEVSSLYNDTTNLIAICDDVIDECNRKYLVCLAELLDELRQFDYVMFDSDAEIDSDFKSYDW